MIVHSFYSFLLESSSKAPPCDDGGQRSCTTMRNSLWTLALMLSWEAQNRGLRYRNRRSIRVRKWAIVVIMRPHLYMFRCIGISANFTVKLGSAIPKHSRDPIWHQCIGFKNSEATTSKTITYLVVSHNSAHRFLWGKKITKRIFSNSDCGFRFSGSIYLDRNNINLFAAFSTCLLRLEKNMTW